MATGSGSIYRIRVQNKGLWIMSHILDLRTISGYPTLSDPVIVSIDFENLIKIINNSGLLQGSNYEAGVAILDTKDLHHSPNCSAMISTFNFAMGSTAYTARASRRFLFGNSITTNNIFDSIRSCIPQDRNIVFIGYGLDRDLQAMQSLGFDFLAADFTAVDIFKLAREVFRKRNWAGSLHDLLSILKCPHTNLHCAGNDASFTLQASLLLTVQGFINKHRDHQRQDNINVIRQLAINQTPNLAIATFEALQKQESKAKKKSQHLKTATSSLTEKQQQIRATREKNRVNNANLDLNLGLFRQVFRLG
ncbi:hypothetical protein F4803DRAFT_556484 [Xylaria telfairii]|nr:hypothetical protein F4803DRAFT_556484 [Xylaria telfairii]